jgi:hypothetical protein
MKELVTVEKAKYEALLKLQQVHKDLERKYSQMAQKYADLERRHFTVLTTKKLADELVNLGNYVPKPVDTNV